MSLLTLNVNLDRVASALERIGDILERSRPKVATRDGAPHDEKDLIVLDNETICQLEEEDEIERRRKLNLPLSPKS